MNHLEKEKLLKQIKSDGNDFSHWLLSKGHQFQSAQNHLSRLYKSAGAFDSQHCSYLGLDGKDEATKLYLQFRKEKEYKQQLNAIPKPKEFENLNQELFQATDNASLMTQLQALKEEIRQLRGN